MTSHFDRYHSMKPQPFSSVEEYENYAKRKMLEFNKIKLLKEANEAIAWGYPDNESTGYSHGQFISLIRRLKDYIEAQ